MESYTRARIMQRNVGENNRSVRNIVATKRIKTRIEDRGNCLNRCYEILRKYSWRIQYIGHFIFYSSHCETFVNSKLIYENESGKSFLKSLRTRQLCVFVFSKVDDKIRHIYTLFKNIRSAASTPSLFSATNTQTNGGISCGPTLQTNSLVSSFTDPRTF